MTNEKKIILSGLRPTGILHIGNYFGALLPLVELQNKVGTLFIMIADLHALTTIEDSKNIGKNTLDFAMTYLAAGIDPKRSTIFVQSQVPQHAELATILGMITPVSMLELNPVYKEMQEEFPGKNSLGLLAYPVLQAADILLYKTTAVPVGKDQAPHIEITREIARKFNSRFGETFPEPKTILQKEAKILSLHDPNKKMSKSHGEKTYISLLDSPDAIRNKIKISVTDSGKKIKHNSDKKPAISNLLTIYHLFSGKPIKEMEKKYTGKGYAEFKNDLAEIIIEYLKPLHKNREGLEKNPDYVKNVLEQGRQRAQKIASRTMEEVKKATGLI